MVIEEPAWSYNGSSFTRYFWATDASKHNVALSMRERNRVPGLAPHQVYAWLYAPGVVMHEFGHAAGLTDLYHFKMPDEGDRLGRRHYTGYLMDVNMGVTSIPRLDRAYIRQVYENHSPH